MTDQTIPEKRLKLDFNEESNVEPQMKHGTIHAILPDELTQPIPQCETIAATITDLKLLSPIMAELSGKLPLNELNHLKRVNRSKIILCKIDDIVIYLQKNPNAIIEHVTDPKQMNANQLKSILKFYLNEHKISAKLIESLCETVEIVSVGNRLPVLNWQYRDISQVWPCKFHPNKEFEKMYNGDWFTAIESEFNLTIMEICRFARDKMNKTVCGIAVDPRTNSIVAIGFDELDKHPLMHCPMVLIDAVARTQLGGAWNDYLLYDGSIYNSVDIVSDDKTLVGVSELIRNLIRSKFPAAQFGAERINDDATDRNVFDIANSDNLAKYGPYLCTGYDVYLTQEPCTMCTMALTHSRVRRIFFNEPQSTGAICSLIKFNSIKALNHHFQAFRIDFN